MVGVVKGDHRYWFALEAESFSKPEDEEINYEFYRDGVCIEIGRCTQKVIFDKFDALVDSASVTAH